MSLAAIGISGGGRVNLYRDERHPDRLCVGILWPGMVDEWEARLTEDDIQDLAEMIREQKLIDAAVRGEFETE